MDLKTGVIHEIPGLSEAYCRQQKLVPISLEEKTVAEQIQDLSKRIVWLEQKLQDEAVERRINELGVVTKDTEQQFQLLNEIIVNKKG